MKANNLHGFRTIDEYVNFKLAEYSKEPVKSFETLFRYMFDETDNVLAEKTDGYRIKRITYGEARVTVKKIALTLSKKLSDVKKDSIVGLYMANSVEWIEIFWAILAAGYRPLLMNSRLPDATLEGIISEHSVAAVISDTKEFPVATVKPSDLTENRGDAEIENSQFGSEVLFMSSGTTEQVKLCAYTGENFYYQICDSVNIIAKCPGIKAHYEGELKQLALLPLYHVFGFIAVYLWFAFFSRTLVFPKDLNPATIQNTVKKHKVTHIFAVPMVWEAVHKAVLSKVKAKGAKTYKKFNKMLGIVNKLGKLGDKLAVKFLSEVRQGLFGDSVKFLITGGSHIKPETLKFFNGIGYHLANGYGMTEIGITSVEFSNSKKMLNSASIGAPFGYTEYSVSEKGELLVRGKTMASRIITASEAKLTDFDKWFETKDLVSVQNGRYYIEGRADDLIVSENGENLNPTIAEKAIKVEGVDRLCVFADSKREPVLILSTPGCFSANQLNGIYDAVIASLKDAKLEGVIKKIYFTPEPLITGSEFKISRKKLSRKFEAGEIRVFDPKCIEKHIDELVSGLEAEIAQCFAEVLEKEPSAIGVNDNFFTDLGGNSIDYFTLLTILKSKFGIELPTSDNDRLATVKDVFNFINK